MPRQRGKSVVFPGWNPDRCMVGFRVRRDRRVPLVETVAILTANAFARFAPRVVFRSRSFDGRPRAWWAGTFCGRKPALRAAIDRMIPDRPAKACGEGIGDSRLAFPARGGHGIPIEQPKKVAVPVGAFVARP